MIDMEKLTKWIKECDAKTFEKKDIYVWGAGVLGICVLDLFKDCGISVKGVIDQRDFFGVGGGEGLYGINVFSPDVIRDIDVENSHIFITASRPNSIRAIISTINSCNDKIEYTVLGGGGDNVCIEISGACNLKCKSCYCGNSEIGDREKKLGFMTPELFEKIVKKVKVDMPDNLWAAMYIFGDPMLSPHLPDMIKILRENQLFSVISTNLSMKVDLEKVIKSNPDCIKISMSGFTQEIYASTHNNGNVELVKSNLRALREEIDRQNASTKVLVGYHIYKNNQGEEYRKVEKLCHELDYIFQPTIAYFNNIMKRTGLQPFSQDDIDFINEYYEEPESILQIPLPDHNKKYDCGFFEKGLFINWDGRVVLCCNIGHKDGILSCQYLDVSFDEIRQMKREHYFCKACVAHGFEWI